MTQEGSEDISPASNVETEDEYGGFCYAVEYRSEAGTDCCWRRTPTDTRCFI